MNLYKIVIKAGIIYRTYWVVASDPTGALDEVENSKSYHRLGGAYRALDTITLIAQDGETRDTRDELRLPYDK